jgi:hypothetical protein
LRDLLDVIIVGGPNFSQLRKLSVELVTYLGSDRLGNPRCRQFGGDIASVEGASR